MPLDAGDAMVSFFPSFLPDGRRFLYQGRFTGSDSFLSVILGSIDPGFQPKRIVPSATNGQIALPGVLLFERDGALFQQPFDLERLDVAGEPTMLVDQLFSDLQARRADFSVSQTGVLAFRTASNRSNQFAWFDRSGKLLETVGPPGIYRTPDLSPDGTRLAYTDVTKGDILIYDLSRKTSSSFAAGADFETAPAWFPDGTKIAYRKREGMFVKDTSATGTEKQLLKETVNGPSQISRDGKWVLYFRVPAEVQGICVIPTTGEPTPRVIVDTPAPDVEPHLSPDGRWVAYASLETGQNEIHVQPFPPTGQRWPVSNSGGRQPYWREDGKELFFVSEDGRLYAVDVDDKAKSFEYGTPRFLFELEANVFNTLRSYIPSRDGQRFLVNTIVGADTVPINVVQNWRAGVER